jgi:N-methylhydantoinase A
LRVAADVGGTFTDIACLSADGELSTVKIPSTPSDFATAVIEGIQTLLRDRQFRPQEVADVLHASTVATNTILEGKGACTALITTEGFRDVLELRRIRVPRLYEPLYEKPAALAPRRRRFEVRERMDSRGAIVTPLDTKQVQELAAHLKSAGVEAVAVSLLHSYINPEHEQQIAAILRAALPGCFISVSSEVLPEIREYERTSTTVVNAYVGPVVSHYLQSLSGRLKAAGIDAPLSMMQSSGGIMDVKRVVAKPAAVVESGPAAGVIGAATIGAGAGYENLITFDMGGTTAKAALIEGGRVVVTDEYEVGGGISLSSRLAKGGGYALKLPVVDVSEVGAGGGSIVRVDAGGALKVGPDSAGADPGPVCYGKGGTEPTVTDASVVLGYLNPAALAGGTVPIHAEKSRAVLQNMADRLGMSVFELAYGIHRLSNSTMMRAVKAVSTYRGRDPRDFTLFAFGGNGGIHAVAVARELQIRKVVVPPAAGVFSAVGLLCANLEAVCSLAFLRPLDAQSARDASRQSQVLERQALEELGTAQGVAVRWRADIRYAGQGFELPVELERGAHVDARTVQQQFEQEYQRTYGHSLGGHAIEFVALRVIAQIPIEQPQPAARVRQAAHRAGAIAFRQAYFGRELGCIDTPVIDRYALSATTRRGPFIIEEYEGTTVVPPQTRALRDARDNIVIELDPESADAH